MTAAEKLIWVVACLSVLTFCVPPVLADSVALMDNGYQPGTLTIDPYSTVGWEFTPICDVWVTALGFSDLMHNGLESNHAIGIWDHSRQLLVTAVVPSAAAADLVDDYRYVPVAHTLLSSGHNYVIGATTGRRPDNEASIQFDADPRHTGHIDPLEIDFDSCINLLAANRHSQISDGPVYDLEFPDLFRTSEPIYEYESSIDHIDFTSGQLVGTRDYYFFAPNFQFVTEPGQAPESTTLLFFAFGAIALTGLSPRTPRSSQSSGRRPKATTPLSKKKDN